MTKQIVIFEFCVFFLRKLIELQGWNWDALWISTGRTLSRNHPVCNFTK